MEEVWKDIPGYEGRYQVSDQGRVMSKDFTRPVGNRWGGLTIRRWPARIRKLFLNKARGNYWYVVLSDMDFSYQRRVAGLVAKAFLGERPTGMQVLHKNGISTDDRASNLRYGTPKENMADMVAHGTRGYGEKHSQAKLTEAQVHAIRESNMPVTNLAKTFGVHRNHIHRIRAGSRWGHG